MVARVAPLVLASRAFVVQHLLVQQMRVNVHMVPLDLVVNVVPKPVELDVLGVPVLAKQEHAFPEQLKIVLGEERELVAQLANGWRDLVAAELT